jgi:Glyoxalase-like domain
MACSMIIERRWAMAASLLAVVVDCRDPRAQADFWARVLSCAVFERNTDEFLVGDQESRATPLYFMRVPEPKVGKNRLHVDVVADGSVEDEVARLTGFGARLVEFRQDPATLDNPDTWAVLEDPEGNVFCVISPVTANTGWV